MPPPCPLVLVHAHPDDETLWTGGTIARYAAVGVRVGLVTCTLGEQGQVLVDELRGLAADRGDQLGGYRLAELRAATAALGVAEQRFLGGLGRWRDSGMVTEPGARASLPPDLHPRAFAGGDPAEQVEQLVATLRELRPSVVVTYGPDGGYGHPDHVRAHDVTTAAAARVPGVERVAWVVQPRSVVHRGLAELAALPAVPFPLPGPDGLPTVDDDAVDVVVDVSAQADRLEAAVRAHATQIVYWTDGTHRAYALDDGVGRPLPPAERYTLAVGSAPPDDLLAGLPA